MEERQKLTDEVAQFESWADTVQYCCFESYVRRHIDDAEGLEAIIDIIVRASQPKYNNEKYYEEKQ